MFKHFIQSTVVKFLTLGIIFIQGVLVARYLGPNGKGIIIIYLSIVNMLVPLSNLGVRQSSSYFYSKHNIDSNLINNYQNTLFVISNILTILFSFIIFSWQRLDNFSIYILLFISIPARLFYIYKLSYALSKRKIEVLNTNEIIIAVSQFSLIAVMIFLKILTVELFFLNYLISHVFGSLYCIWWLWKNNLLNFRISFYQIDKQWLHFFTKGLKYALPLFIMGLNYKADIIILNNFVSKSDIGIYSVGVNITELIWLLPQVYSLIIFSYSVSTLDALSFSINLFRRTKRILFFSLIAILIFLIFAAQFIQLLYGDAYSSSYYVLIYLIPGVYFMIAFKILNGDLAARGYPLIAFWVFTIAIIVNIIMNFILIPSLGINGAAIASSISYTLGSFVFIYKYYQISIRQNV